MLLLIARSASPNKKVNWKLTEMTLVASNKEYLKYFQELKDN